MDFFTESEKKILLESDEVVVGFSGGADSTLALFAAFEFLASCEKTEKLTALHVNHQTQGNSDSWAEHCSKICQQHKIKFEEKKVNVEQQGQGYEAAARAARFGIFDAYKDGTIIILGHHMDDQVETVFFRVLRGTGLKGLSGMQRVSNVKGKVVIRPMLNLSKDEIIDISTSKKLDFIEDESNEDNAYSRNFLRNQIIPKITARWPAARKNTARMANLLAKQSNLYHRYLSEKLEKVCDDDGLLISELIELDYFERSEIIRIWLDKQSYASPNESQMKELEKSFFHSRQTANPIIKFHREDAEKKSVLLTKTNNYLIAEELND